MFCCYKYFKYLVALNIFWYVESVRECQTNRQTQWRNPGNWRLRRDFGKVFVIEHPCWWLKGYSYRLHLGNQEGLRKDWEKSQLLCSMDAESPAFNSWWPGLLSWLKERMQETGDSEVEKIPESKGSGSSEYLKVQLICSSSQFYHYWCHGADLQNACWQIIPFWVTHLAWHTFRSCLFIHCQSLAFNWNI